MTPNPASSGSGASWAHLITSARPEEGDAEKRSQSKTISIWCRAGRERVSKGISFYHRLELLTRRLQHRLLIIHRESDPCPLVKETCPKTQLE